MTDTKMKAVVLAAGIGKRLQTGENDAPKVMRLACGKPLLWYVLDALSFIDKKDTIIVVGYKKDAVISHFPGYSFAVQEEQKGTGHAVMAAGVTGAAGDELSGYDGPLLVCCGDMPAIRRGTYEALARVHRDEGNDCTLLTGESSLRLPYGRIIRGGDGGFQKIVEERDCSPDQFSITELNSGVYVFQTPQLFDALKRLDCNNAQSEYYLTDVPEIILRDGARIGLHRRDLGDEIIGVNTLEQLTQVEAILRNRLFPILR